ncbi:MAG TPA: C4-type zinc ribbon domain-containing protein [Acidobacteriaceae bacterium]|nr:C4-type zinc ribbon domain-containing protein [Acidobacteriaceae bacterium]
MAYVLDCVFTLPRMHEKLEKLVHLQELEQQAQSLSHQIAQYTGRVEIREAALYDTERLLEQNAALLAKEASLRRSLELDAEEMRDKSARYRTQLNDAKSDGQVKALEHQLKFCKKEIDRIDELEFASLMETEALEVKQRLLHETRANQTQLLETEKATSQLGRDRDKVKLAELYRQRDAARAEADPELLAQYDRMASAHKTPIATVEQQRCSACQMMVRPQRWNEIRQGAVHFCESCGRFLYFNSAIDLSDSIHLPSTQKKPAGLAKDAAHPKPTGSDRPQRED